MPWIHYTMICPIPWPCSWIIGMNYYPWPCWLSKGSGKGSLEMWWPMTMLMLWFLLLYHTQPVAGMGMLFVNMWHLPAATGKLIWSPNLTNTPFFTLPIITAYKAQEILFVCPTIFKSLILNWRPPLLSASPAVILKRLKQMNISVAWWSWMTWAQEHYRWKKCCWTLVRQKEKILVRLSVPCWLRWMSWNNMKCPAKMAIPAKPGTLVWPAR